MRPRDEAWPTVAILCIALLVVLMSVVIDGPADKVCLRIAECGALDAGGFRWDTRTKPRGGEPSVASCVQRLEGPNIEDFVRDECDADLRACLAKKKCADFLACAYQPGLAKDGCGVHRPWWKLRF